MNVIKQKIAMVKMLENEYMIFRKHCERYEKKWAKISRIVGENKSNIQNIYNGKRGVGILKLKELNLKLK